MVEAKAVVETAEEAWAAGARAAAARGRVATEAVVTVEVARAVGVSEAAETEEEGRRR